MTDSILQWRRLCLPKSQSSWGDSWDSNLDGSPKLGSLGSALRSHASRAFVRGGASLGNDSFPCGGGHALGQAHCC